MKFVSVTSFVAALVLVLILADGSGAYASPRKAVVVVVPKVSFTYTGKGSAQLNEEYSQHASMACRVDTNSYGETVDAVTWDVRWNNVALNTGKNTSPKSASFSGTLNETSGSRANISACPAFQLNSCQVKDPACVMFSAHCGSTSLSYAAGSFPQLGITKKGKNYLVTIEAETATDTAPIVDALSGATTSCGNSTVFDNNIVDGVKGQGITRFTVKLSPATKSKKTSLAINLPNSFDCTDQYRIGASGISNSCTITTAFQANLQVNGKWNASVVK